MPTEEFLTKDELHALELTRQLAVCVGQKVIENGPQYDNDWAEFAADIHRIQYRIMAQAAGRAYPGQFRLLGHSIQPPNGKFTPA